MQPHRPQFIKIYLFSPQHSSDTVTLDVYKEVYEFDLFNYFKMLNFPAEPDSLDFDTIGSTALSTPAYSPVPSRTEISLDAKRLSPHGPSWVYKTKHMSIDLGRRLWGTSSPAYGLHDKIEGSIRLSGPHPELIEDISVTVSSDCYSS